MGGRRTAEAQGLLSEVTLDLSLNLSTNSVRSSLVDISMDSRLIPRPVRGNEGSHFGFRGSPALVLRAMSHCAHKHDNTPDVRKKSNPASTRPRKWKYSNNRLRLAFGVGGPDLSERSHTCRGPGRGRKFQKGVGSIGAGNVKGNWADSTDSRKNGS